MNTLANTLKGKKCAVPLIHVADGRAKSKDIEGTQATDTEEELLLDAGFLIATVEVAGDPLVGLIVFRNKGVEENELHAADIRDPNPAPHAAIREGDIDGVAGVTQREVFRMHGRVVFNLPAIVVDVLAEIAFAIEKADGGEGDAEVTGSLAVISGQYA